jgi:hypothetical protein
MLVPNLLGSGLCDQVIMELSWIIRIIIIGIINIIIKFQYERRRTKMIIRGNIVVVFLLNHKVRSNS